MHTAASQSVFVLTILCLVCCWQNPVCLNKTLEAALNFRPPSNSKWSPGSMPAWKLVNPANKDSTASPAVTRKTLAAVLEVSFILEEPSLCMHLPWLKSRAALLVVKALWESCPPNKIWGEKGAELSGVSSTLQDEAMLLTGFLAAESMFFLCWEAEWSLACIFPLTLSARGGSALRSSFRGTSVVQSSHVHYFISHNLLQCDVIYSRAISSPRTLERGSVF